jgi:IclR family transcriptional regulator, acetate operon repressor
MAATNDLTDAVTATDRVGVKSARRAVELVEAFAAADDWMTPGDLHESTGMPRSSLHGLLHTLVEVGWLEANPPQTRYRLGVRALICGTAYLDRDPAVPYATRALEEVREQTGFTVHFARRHGREIVYLETRESQHSTHLVSRVGRTLPAHATSLGKALLAELTPAEVAGLLPESLPALTSRTLVSRERLEQQLVQVRETGWAAEVEEGTVGVRCVAAAIPYRIPATDALSCSMPVDQADDAVAKQVAGLLVEAATTLGRKLRNAGIR